MASGVSVRVETAIHETQTRLRFYRQEWSGAFGDLGTDLPLIVGMILAAGLDAASVLTVFGLMQIGTALRYRMPMPVQPLKAMAASGLPARQASISFRQAASSCGLQLSNHQPS